MNYRETDQKMLHALFAQWEHYKTVNSLFERPAGERFQAFKAAWTWFEYDPDDEDEGRPVAPPEYDMLLDWLAARSSGFWEPTKEP